MRTDDNRFQRPRTAGWCEIGADGGFDVILRRHRAVGGVLATGTKASGIKAGRRVPVGMKAMARFADAYSLKHERTTAATERMRASRATSLWISIHNGSETENVSDSTARKAGCSCAM